ncbi:HtaA domain-containing protein [Stackebrandtia soli]|uniref:HtaA domain-containing protein n=1 Tax=Stackebrandtia soli TaxID=1892856 RepID=UPI0039E85B04
MSASRRTRASLALIVAFTCAFMTALTATPAHAADTVSGGRLDWGIKKSFQNYVTGPIAKGAWSLVDGAGTTGDSQFRFHSATGDYDGGSGAFTARYSGGVRFQGHPTDDGGFEMDLTITNPTVELAGGNGTLYVDIITRHGGETSTNSRVPFGTLGVSGLDTRDAGTSLALFDVPVTLTAEGATAFEGYYSAGTALDPMNFSGDITAAPADDDDAKDDDEDKDDGEFSGAAVDWGVKRTWREFVAGDIAKGGWELADGAQDGGALFRFPDGDGEYDEKKSTLTAEFEGSLSFTGDGVDVTFSDVAMKITKDEGILTATVTADGDTTKDAEIVTFDASDLAAADGLILIDQVPTVLTEDGATALAGLYQPGTAMDPITVAVPLDADAAIPPLPDLGSDPEPTPSAEDAATETPAPGTPWATVIAIAAGVAVLALALGLIWRQRRKSSAPDTGDARADTGTHTDTDVAPAPDGDAKPDTSTATPDESRPADRQ